MNTGILPRIALAAALLPFLLASCASSGGSTFSKAESGEAAAAAQAQKPPAPNGKPTPPRPPKSERGDEHPKDDEGGKFVLVFEKPPEPELPTGRLVLVGLEPDASVYVDGAYSSGSTYSLPVGTHELRVARFGYRDFEVGVTVYEDQSSSLKIDYQAAPFAIRSLDASPPSFDPADPGSLGYCDLSVLVAAPGEGRATVLNPEGASLRDLGPLSFASAFTRLRWDGRDDAGKALPPGAYLVRVEGSGAGGESDASEARVEIASGLFSRHATLYSGVSGSLFAPDARALAPGLVESSMGTELHLAPRGNIMSGLTTVHIGLRAGLPASTCASELEVSLMSVIWQGSPDASSYSVTGAWKRTLGMPGSNAAAAAYIKATLARYFNQDPESSIAPPWDGAARYSGISAGLSLEYAASSLRAFAAPELEVSNYYPNWIAGPWETPGLFSWAYLRLGLEAKAGDCTIALSGALRSAPFGGKLELIGPYPLGLEATWYSPSSPWILSFIATGEVEDLANYYFGAGFSLGFRM
jgi:hypothetical protein